MSEQTPEVPQAEEPPRKRRAYRQAEPVEKTQQDARLAQAGDQSSPDSADSISDKPEAERRSPAQYEDDADDLPAQYEF